MKVFKEDVVDQMNPQHMTALRTWLTLPILVMLVSCGTLLSDTRTSSSTHTLVSSVLLSIHTRDSPSTPSAPWSCMSAREGMSAGHTSLPLLREPTRAWPTLAATSPSLLLESL